jgi:hypothetical protein
LPTSDRGKLVFEENDRDPELAQKFLKQAPIWQWNCILWTFVLYAILIYMLLTGALDFSIWAVLVIIPMIAAMLFFDFLFFHQMEHSIRPLRIYEKGIDMPLTSFERRFLKRGFVRWEQIKTLFSVRHSTEDRDETEPKIVNEIIVITRDKEIYSTWTKKKEEIAKALGVISKLWPGYSSEQMKIDGLEERRRGFSRFLASLDPPVILQPIALFNVLLLVSLGVSVFAGQDHTISLAIVALLLIFLLAFGVVLAMAQRSRRMLIEDTQW